MEMIAFVLAMLSDPVQQECMTEAIYFESRGEPITGQLLVGRSIMARTKGVDSVCSIINAAKYPGLGNCQYEYKCDGKREDMLETNIIPRTQLIAAVSILLGVSENMPTHFYSGDEMPSWCDSVFAVIEKHTFCLSLDGTRSYAYSY